MGDFMQNAGGVIFGAFVGCGFGLLSFWLQRRWIARDDFHAVIDEQIAKLDIIDRSADQTKPSRTIDAEDLFLEESIPVLITAARRLRRHISDDEWDSLSAALNEYKAYQTKNKGLTGRCLNTNAGNPAFSEILHDYLKTIDECISTKPIA